LSYPSIIALQNELFDAAAKGWLAEHTDYKDMSIFDEIEEMDTDDFRRTEVLNPRRFEL
jgi:hypothetical protein